MFSKGNSYNRRRDIHDKFGGNRQSGIAPCANHPYVFLFSSPTGKIHGYRDGWQQDGTYLYTGEGQYGDMEFSNGNKAILKHVEQGRALLLFVKQSDGLYFFEGEFRYQTHHVIRGSDTDKHIRSTIQFILERV